MSNEKFEKEITEISELSDLHRKMLFDTEFLSRTKFCGSLFELYKLYLEYGYTDLNFEIFKKVFDTFYAKVEKNEHYGELAMDELSEVVGGGIWSKRLRRALSFVPVAGPFIEATC